MRFLQMLQAFPRFSGGACPPPDDEAEPPAAAVPFAVRLTADAFDFFEVVPPFLSPPPVVVSPPPPPPPSPVFPPEYVPGSGGVVP